MRFVVIYRGENPISIEEMISLLPSEAFILLHHPPRVFVVQANEFDLRRSLKPDDEWVITVEQAT